MFCMLDRKRARVLAANTRRVPRELEVKAVSLNSGQGSSSTCHHFSVKSGFGSKTYDHVVVDIWGVFFMGKYVPNCSALL